MTSSSFRRSSSLSLEPVDEFRSPADLGAHVLADAQRRVAPRRRLLEPTGDADVVFVRPQRCMVDEEPVDRAVYDLPWHDMVGGQDCRSDADQREAEQADEDALPRGESGPSRVKGEEAK